MSRSRVFACLVGLMLIAAAALAAGPEVANVPIGVTDLLANPACTVSYHLDSGPSHVLGWRWTGYDPDSGVYFTVEPIDGIHNQVFMHCPWAKGPGVTNADFPLKLPAGVPIRLELKTALRTTETNSDGVSYRVLVDGKRLWESFCTWKTWHDFTVDLSAYAGRTVHLVLQVDPGPKRNTTDDWSLWGEATIVAGTDAQVAAARARAAREAAAQLQRDMVAAGKRAQADLSAFSSGRGTDPCPNTAASVKDSIARHGTTYVLTCRGADETIEYRINPSGGLLGGLNVAVNGKVLDPPPFSADVSCLLGGKEKRWPSSNVTMTPTSEAIVDGSLLCHYDFRAAGINDVAHMTVRLRPEGKTLVLHVGGPPNRFTRVALHGTGRNVQTTFGIGPVKYRREGVFLGYFVDVWQSNASGIGSGDLASYQPLTNGTLRPLKDTFYLTVSNRYEEVLPNIPNKPSPFLAEEAGRVVLDTWGGSFAENEQWLRDIARYGVDHFWIIKHVWQHDGYDHSYPDTMPANAAMGGDRALRSLSLTAQKLGNRFCVHENYYDYYPNAKDFHKQDCCLDSGGRTINGWWNGSVQALVLKPSKIMYYVRRFSPEIKRRYDCDGSYFDTMPAWHVDYDARVPGSGMIRVTHEITRQMCDYWRKLYGGPVLFEAADPHLAGVYDGGDNHGVGNWQTPPAGAYEMMKVHTKMSNHGFGYYERWLPWGYSLPIWNTYVMTDRELDLYRATEVAFGRTGFIGHQLMKSPHDVVREYYLMQAFGHAYTDQPLTHLAYWLEAGGQGGWVDAGTAALYRNWSRMRATYKGGEVVYANLSDKPWKVDGHVLPAKGGTLATGPRATAWTAEVDGQIADFAKYGDVTYADARSHAWLPPKPPAPLIATLGPWKDKGNGNLQVSVNWKIGRTLSKDYTIFVHFKANGKILFQADHAPAKPTSQWKAGDTFVDGPLSIHVPDDPIHSEYDLTVGLYNKDGRALLDNGGMSKLVAKLEVVRDTDGKAVSLRFTPAKQQVVPGSDPKVYLEGANVDHKLLDFGPVATNGAVVLRKSGAGVEVIPVPIGQAMRVGIAGNFTKAIVGGKALQTSRRDGKLWFDMPAGAENATVR